MPAEPWAAHLGAGRSFDVGQLHVAASLPDRWRSVWTRSPTAQALRVEGTVGSGRWLGTDELESKSRAAAAALAAFGVRAGDRVVWSVQASEASILAALGVLRQGAVLVPVNPAYTQREIAHIVTDVRPALAVVEPGAAGLWQTAGGGPAHVLGAEELLGASGVASAADLDEAGPDDPALIVYTSGTTGTPKGALLRHRNVVAGLEAIRLAWRWEPEDRLLSALPLFHVHGLCVALLGSLHAGASLVVLDRFDAPRVAGGIPASAATLFFGVPTMYHRLLGTPGADALASLRLCVCGSAPLSADLWNELRARLGAAVLERYGMSETLLTISNPVEGDRRAGTVGLALPGTELAVGGAGQAPVPVAPGAAAEGTLFVRGPSVFDGYWERPQVDAECFVDGWFDTGDIVGVEVDGYVTIKGRAKELIISGGYNVYPAEVEEVLAGCPGIQEAAVTGMASEEWGEVVTAWLVPVDGPLADDAVLAFCAERLAPYKRPRRVRWLDALPRTALGKVQRSELR
jgi:malonyl-CoA/methylmalonyl-CoA synthetase